jgi:hypothetical protein
VFAVVDGRLLRRFVVLGEARDDTVTVLSGLAAGESLVADAESARARESSR